MTVECLNCHISHAELQSPAYDHTQKFLGAEEVGANNVMLHVPVYARAQV